eukprot:TRINITY_DN3459_c1_g1_i1.p1 TRINITY_DN3459_c1_g1~~TRINITY_DN3459_c1_g1_i1.p1  ORF type:complete len:747 (+),score=237.74 TRINITY_DN3459_c1_g1_i1:34-2241(+)
MPRKKRKQKRKKRSPASLESSPMASPRRSSFGRSREESSPQTLPSPRLQAQQVTLSLSHLTAAEISKCRAVYETAGDLEGGAVAQKVHRMLLRLRIRGPGGSPSEADAAELLECVGWRPCSRVTLAQFLAVVQAIKIALAAAPEDTDSAAAREWRVDVFDALGGEAGEVSLSLFEDLCEEFGVVAPVELCGKVAVQTPLTPASGASQARRVDLAELRFILEEEDETEIILAFLSLGASHPDVPDLAERMSGGEDEADAAVRAIAEELGPDWYHGLFVMGDVMQEFGPELGMDPQQVAAFIESADDNGDGEIDFTEFARFVRESQVKELRERRGQIEARRQQADSNEIAPFTPLSVPVPVAAPEASHKEEVRETTATLKTRLFRVLKRLRQRQLTARQDMPQGLQSASQDDPPSWLPRASFFRERMSLNAETERRPTLGGVQALSAPSLFSPSASPFRTAAASMFFSPALAARRIATQIHAMWKRGAQSPSSPQHSPVFGTPPPAGRKRSSGLVERILMMRRCSLGKHAGDKFLLHVDETHSEGSDEGSETSFKRRMLPPKQMTYSPGHPLPRPPPISPPTPPPPPPPLPLPPPVPVPVPPPQPRPESVAAPRPRRVVKGAWVPPVSRHPTPPPPQICCNKAWRRKVWGARRRWLHPPRTWASLAVAVAAAAASPERFSEGGSSPPESPPPAATQRRSPRPLPGAASTPQGVPWVSKRGELCPLLKVPPVWLEGVA